MKNTIENIKLVLQMGIIGVILLYIGTTVFMPDLTVKIFRFQPFITVTESMDPVIKVNDVVVVTAFDIDEAEVGDIITFKADIDYNGTEETVTHYIYEIDQSGEQTIIRTNRHFETDENITPDTWLIPAEDVIGSYAFQIPYLGLLIGFIKSPYGIVIIAINIATVFAIKYINKKSNMTPEHDSVEQKVSNPSDFPTKG